ncbi:hypothetical protein BO71DRAFT_313989, partial [Aspergillus ellipticus CBS 707.79]
YEDDLVVGADGVYSAVRQLMWNDMETRGLSEEVAHERKRMTSEYSCVFGISTETPGLVPGHVHRTFGEGYSLLVITSKNGRVYWFLFTKLDRKYASHEIPRFKKEDVENHVAPWLGKPITGSVVFEDAYKRAIVKTHLALEEANYEHWCKDRWVCIGDSAHKMTPNAGQGGNSAIESAVTPTNSLAKLVQSKSPLQLEDLDLCLQSWQKARKPRLTKIWNSAQDLTRLEACATFKHKLVALHLLPHLQTIILDKTSADIIGAEKLDCLPPPPRSLRVTMPYIKEADVQAEQGSWKRGIWCIPFLGCFRAARATMTPLIANTSPHMAVLFAQGSWTARNGESVALQKSLYPIPFLDKLLNPLITCFLPSISGTDPVSNIQMRSFITDLGAAYGIWVLESYRNAHSPVEVLLPVLTGSVLQLNGAGLWTPIYYALEYFQVSFPKLLSHGRHEVTAKRTASLALAMLAGYYLPTYQSFTASTVDSRRWWNAVWQIFPIVVPALASTISWLAPGKSQQNADTPEAKNERSKKNMTMIRAVYVGFAAISGLTWVHGLRSAPTDSSLLTIFWPGLNGHSSAVTSFMDGIARFLQYDQIISMTSGFIWLGLRLRELKQSGASFSWWQVASVFVGTTAAFGSGAAFALGWGWKEELMNKLSLQQSV